MIVSFPRTRPKWVKAIDQVTREVEKIRVDNNLSEIEMIGILEFVKLDTFHGLPEDDE